MGRRIGRAGCFGGVQNRRMGCQIRSAIGEVSGASSPTLHYGSMDAFCAQHSGGNGRSPPLSAIQTCHIAIFVPKDTLSLPKNKNRISQRPERKKAGPVFHQPAFPIEPGTFPMMGCIAGKIHALKTARSVKVSTPRPSLPDLETQIQPGCIADNGAQTVLAILHAAAKLSSNNVQPPKEDQPSLFHVMQSSHHRYLYCIQKVAINRMCRQLCRYCSHRVR